MFLIVLFGARAATDCEPSDLHADIQRATEAITVGASSKAIPIITALEENLTCQQDWVTPKELITLFETGAVAATYSNIPTQANAWWLRRCVVGERTPLSEDLTPSQREAYTTTCSALSERKGLVESDISVMIDGWMVLPDQPWSLIEGDHLLQYQDSTGNIVTEWLVVFEGRTVPAGPVVAKKSTSKIPFLVVGGTLVAAGTATLLGSGLVFDQALNAPATLPDSIRTVNAMRFGGTAAVGVGFSSMLIAALLKP